MAKDEHKGDKVTIQENNLVLSSDIHIVRLNTRENVLLLLTPHASNLDQYPEFVPSSQRVTTGDGEGSLSVQITYAEPIAKNAKPIMNYHY